MKKLILIAVLLSLVVLQQGCSGKYRTPNTQKGRHLDAINYHTGQISEINPIIFEQNEVLIPKKAVQLGDVSAFQERMRARMQGMKGGN
jgi:hypothetical protein